MNMHECLAAHHTVVMDAVETTYAVYPVTIGLDDDDQAVVKVARAESLDTEVGALRLDRYRCLTCGTELPDPHLEIVNS